MVSNNNNNKNNNDNDNDINILPRQNYDQFDDGLLQVLFLIHKQSYQDIVSIILSQLINR